MTVIGDVRAEQLPNGVIRCFLPTRSTDARAWGEAKASPHGECAGEDLNLHVPGDTRPSTLRVYQFRHQRVDAAFYSRRRGRDYVIGMSSRSSVSRSDSSHAGSASFWPSVTEGSSTRKPGPSVAISIRIPSG